MSSRVDQWRVIGPPPGARAARWRLPDPSSATSAPARTENGAPLWNWWMPVKVHPFNTTLTERQSDFHSGVQSQDATKTWLRLKSDNPLLSAMLKGLSRSLLKMLLERVSIDRLNV